MNAPGVASLLHLAAVSAEGGRVDRMLVIFLAVCGVALALVHVAGYLVWRGKLSLKLAVPAGVTMAFGILTLFVVSEDGWRALRTARSATAELEPQRVMVVGEQFAWSVIRPGPDNEVGRYLVFPRPEDELWPNPGIVDMATAADPPAYAFAGVRGPADLPAEDREAAIRRYTQAVNPLGKEFADPRGWDDDWQGALGRDLVVEAGRPVEVRLGSKDVIHDFFVPAMRVKMDAVPGLAGTVRFTPMVPGRYRVLCAEFCGWGHTQMSAELVVEEES